MRVVSQHGNVDLPYERTVICHGEDSVIARCDGNEYTLGMYSSKEKTYKAMEMLREDYKAYIRARCNETIFIFVAPKVFRFPLDSEVE